MKNILKWLLIIIVLLIGGVLVAGLFIKKDFHFEKSIAINAPQEKVWDNVSSLKAMDTWSPWDDKDSVMQKTFTGTDGAVDSKMTWKGNEEVGEGSETITKVQAKERIECNLDFIKPFKSHAEAYIQLTAKDTSTTTVTWGFDSKFDYPMNAIMPLMNMEKTMGEEFTKGLNSLKAIAEKKP